MLMIAAKMKPCLDAAAFQGPASFSKKVPARWARMGPARLHADAMKLQEDITAHTAALRSVGQIICW